MAQGVVPYHLQKVVIQPSGIYDNKKIIPTYIT